MKSKPKSAPAHRVPSKPSKLPPVLKENLSRSAQADLKAKVGKVIGKKSVY